MKIYSRAGDSGETTLLNGDKISKDDSRIVAIGDLDELNSLIGVVISFSGLAELSVPLKKIQQNLFVIGAEIADEKSTHPSKITPIVIEDVEHLIDSLSAELPQLTHFILPGGDRLAALLHHGMSAG